ncbi:hypothetical protein JZ751_015468 [Albula glossodonta]|uniref:Palmitoyltransferase n=1 Tax=Albula glossodonta TaxID=121402 RepID=A0A8T2MV68_9TELE|nr:hypothetical protein JZ751_015468 [Albula glossodonta]
MKNCEYQQIDPRALSTPITTPLPPPCAKKTKRPQRKWEVFPGRNRFYCDGRIIVARQSGVLPLTLGLILVTSSLFFVFDCPFLVEHLTTCIPVIGGVLFVLVVISLLQTSFTDPGILPRATLDEAADIEKQIDNSGSSTYRPPPRTREVLINEQVVKLKNYRFFYTFIVSLSFLTAFIFGCAPRVEKASFTLCRRVPPDILLPTNLSPLTVSSVGVLELHRPEALTAAGSKPVCLLCL